MLSDEQIRGDIFTKLAVPLWPHTGRALNLQRGATYAAAEAGKIPTLDVSSRKKDVSTRGSAASWAATSPRDQRKRREPWVSPRRRRLERLALNRAGPAYPEEIIPKTVTLVVPSRKDSATASIAAVVVPTRATSRPISRRGWPIWTKPRRCGASSSRKLARPAARSIASLSSAASRQRC